MLHFSPRSAALLAIAFTAAGISSGAVPARIVPNKGEKIGFARTYSVDHLKNNPLQRVTKTSLILRNNQGLLTATWDATFRDIRTDENVERSATGICKPHGSRKIECTFDAATGTVNLASRTDGLFVSIPVGQGVQFSSEKEGVPSSEFLLGTDEDSNAFRLNKKK